MTTIAIWERIAGFWRQEDAAVTVDWVVLTAAVLALVAAMFGLVQGGLMELVDAIVHALGSHIHPV